MADEQAEQDEGKYEVPEDLKTALQWSDRQMADFRQKRIEVLAEYAGHHYGKNAKTEKTPVNIINAYVGIYQRQVAVNEPQSLITTPHQDLAASAAEFKLAVNERVSQMNVESAFNEAGLEALFMLGCVETGIDENGDPFVENVLFDDLILDMSAKTWKQVGFVGHRFRAPLDWVRGNESFDPEMRKKAAPSEESDPRIIGSGDADNQSQTITYGSSRKVEEFKRHIELVQLFLPEEGMLLIFFDNDPKNLLLAKKWQGPPQLRVDDTKVGMYSFLSYVRVPGNLLPIGPAQLWRDIHDVLNRLANKVFRQAERQKTVLTGGSKEDMERFVNSSDGDGIHTDDPDKIQEKTTGGANQVTLGMVTWLRNLASYVAGNADMLGGTAATTDTVGQDQILFQSAGTQVKQMQHRMLQFARSILADVAWWLWTDPIGEQAVSRAIPGTGEKITFNWDASRRKGSFEQYRFDIEPYSVTHRTPQERLAALFGAMDKLTMQYGPQMQAAGMSFDMEKLVKTVADYANLPELAGMVIYQMGQQSDEAGGNSGPGRPVAPPRPQAPQQPSSNPLGDMESMMMSKMMAPQGQ